MATIKDVKLRDLYFISDDKHRRAFLTALRELEEEGFEIEEAETATIKIKNLQAESHEKQKLAANSSSALGLQGTTPAELSIAARLKSQNARRMSQTNAVDMKDYKYWREDEYKKIVGEPVSKSQNIKNADSDFSRFLPKTKKSGATLYDELFGDDNETETFEPFPKTKTYRAIESVLGEESSTQHEEDRKEQAADFRTSYLADKRNLEKIERNKALVAGLAKDNKHKREFEERKAAWMEETQKLIEERKREKAAAIEGEEKTVVDAEVSKAKKPAAKRKSAAKNAVDNLDIIPAEEADEPSKIVVEVVAPAGKEETETKDKPKKPRKPRGKAKKKKKVDHDIKRYHSIVID